MAASAKDEAVEKLWTPANVVTLTRICAIPVFVVALLSPWPAWFPQWSSAIAWKEWVAAAIFMLLASTDALDGYLARSRGEVTNFGKFIYPLADKILVAAALLALIELGVLPSWVALVILCREFIVSGIRMVAASQSVVIAASWYGKIKTVLQIFALVLFIIKDNSMLHSISDVFNDGMYLFSWAIMIAALIATIVSMLDYFVKARHLLGFANSNNGAPSLENRKTKVDSSSCAAHRQTEEVQSEVDKLAERLIKEACKRNISLATAESCTGGLVSSALTSVAGSSQVFLGGIVSYANEVKQTELGVSSGDLQNKGAVSEEVARQMARGAKTALSADVAVSVTGIAGPGGGSPEKPVGTVWIGTANAAGERAEVHHFEGNREEIRNMSLIAALQSFEKEIFG